MTPHVATCPPRIPKNPKIFFLDGIGAQGGGMSRTSGETACTLATTKKMYNGHHEKLQWPSQHFLHNGHHKHFFKSLLRPRGARGSCLAAPKNKIVQWSPQFFLQWPPHFFLHNDHHQHFFKSLLRPRGGRGSCLAAPSFNKEAAPIPS